MKLKLTSKFVLTFLALTFLLHEAHEIVHTATGRIICGSWGQRDFNVWSLGGNCAEQNSYAVLATFSGPIFTYLMIWVGAFLMNKKNENHKALGFSLVFANMPFTRLFGAITGGGDEVWGLNIFLQHQNLAWLIGTLMILALISYPIYKSFKIIDNESPIVWFLLFLLILGQIDTWIILIALNSLIQNEFLSDYWVLGSPILVTVWTALVTLTYLFTRKNIYELIKK